MQAPNERRDEDRADNGHAESTDKSADEDPSMFSPVMSGWAAAHRRGTVWFFPGWRALTWMHRVLSPI
jgi:hypothetical protein